MIRSRTSLHNIWKHTERDPNLDNLVCMKIKLILIYCFIKLKKYPHWYQCLQPLTKDQFLSTTYWRIWSIFKWLKALITVWIPIFSIVNVNEREDWSNHLIKFFENHKSLLFQAISLLFPDNSLC